MKVVLKAGKETPDTTLLLRKIKAEALFEGQGAQAERRSQLQKIHNHSLWHGMNPSDVTGSPRAPRRALISINAPHSRSTSTNNADKIKDHT
jgi:hypothetical protein